MRITREYEPSDIDLNDKFLSGLSLCIALSGISMQARGDEPTDEAIKRGVAAFLNTTAKLGITVAMAEDVPEQVRSAFDKV
jgi:hypothetical protein